MWGRGRFAAVTLAVLPLVLAAPARGAGQVYDDQNVTATMTGSVAAVWHPVPGACAASGLCAFSGSVTATLSGSGDAAVTGAPGRAFVNDLFVDQQTPAIVRVQRDGPDGPSMCLDSIDIDPFVGLRPAANGRLAIALGEPAFSPILGSGRCGGPLPGDLPALVVSHPVDSHRLGRRPVTVDFAGRTPFAHGPFAGELVSTLRLTIGRARLIRESADSTYSSPPPRRRRTRRVQTIGLQYDVESVSGGVRADFAGLPGPGCTPLDACGASGSVGYSLAATPEEVDVFGQRRVRGDGAGLGFALLALRQGRMHTRVEALSTRPDDFAGQGSATSRITLPGGSVCSDTATGEAASLDSGAHPLELLLGPSSQLGGDAVRTRCPGPSQADLAGGGALASGRLDARTLGNNRIDLPLRTAGPLVGPGYAGSRSGEIVLHLRLRHAGAQVVR
ncbi:MAG: hypothetical protein ACJ768_06930 [Gaiellaceae bacterium]